jgi:hypothetical protein
MSFRERYRRFIYKAYFASLGIAKIIDFVPGTYVLDKLVADFQEFH